MAFIILKMMSSRYALLLQHPYYDKHHVIALNPTNGACCTWSYDNFWSV